MNPLLKFILVLALSCVGAMGKAWADSQSFSLPSIQLLARGGSENQVLDGVNVDPPLVKKKLSVTDLQDDSWRSSLPIQLQKRRGALHRFILPTGHKRIINDIVEDMFCEVYVLGTAHVSKDSCEDVKLLMNHVKPDVLFVELCNQRIAILDDNSELLEKIGVNATSSIESVKDVSISQLCKDVMEHNPGMSKAAALSSALLTKIQGDYASKLNVTIGGEFKAAFRIANEQQKHFMDMLQNFDRAVDTEEYDILLDKLRSMNGCVTVLGDRPVRLTLCRAWEALSFFGKIKLVFGLVWSSFRQPNVDELKEWIESIINDPTNDILTKSIEELSVQFPAIKKTIIEERDIYMGCKILQTAEIMGRGSLQDGMIRKIVCIVGAGHCPGISRKLSNVIENGATVSSVLEQEIRSVVETKSHKVDEDPNMKNLLSEVTSMEFVLP